MFSHNDSSIFKTDYDVQTALNKEGLKPSDYKEICKRLKRAPNRVELGMFGVMWSEHCCYRNSKPLLLNFPTTGPRILVGPGENAGVVDIGSNQKLVFKIESHNHPSAIEPFQGAATGVGGILRDIFTMGARPIALLNALRFGPLEEDRNIALMEGVVAGIAHYGNCVGVPTIGGEVSFDSSYTGNPLVNAMALGLMETDDIVCSGASGVDYPVLYVGSTTGRDGMGGASFASSELTSSSLDDRPAVQVGDPFLEKGLIEACLEVFKSGDIVAAQDMGAAGLTCSSSEMASKGGMGIELDLDLVPAREANMSAYEYLLSESQERMLFIVKPGSEQNVINKIKKWDLNAIVVGKVLKDNVVRVLHHGNIVADLPASALADDTPVENHDLLKEPPSEVLDLWKWSEDTLPDCDISGIHMINHMNQSFISWNNVLLKLLDFPNIASKRWIYQQYDYQVQSNTVYYPGCSDAAIIRIRDQNFKSSDIQQNRGIAACVDCPNRLVFLDPERGSIAAVAEAARNLTCVGATPLAVTDNLNFSSPDDPTGYWQLSMSCKGIATACDEFSTPVIGGNVSLYNETRIDSNKKKPIHPTPVIGMVGLIEDLSNICDQSFKSNKDLIYMLGIPTSNNFIKDKRISLAGSTYLEVIHGLVAGRPPSIDFDLEKAIQNFVRFSISQGILKSAHDVSDGGIAIALAESCISSNKGATIDLKFSEQRIDNLLFAEGGSRIIVSIDSSDLDKWQAEFSEKLGTNGFGEFLTFLGSVTDEKQLQIYNEGKILVDLPIEKLVTSFENAIPRRMN